MKKKYLALSKILKNLLFENNIKPITLAKKINMKLSTISRIVTGKSTRPHKASLESIANYFNISVNQLTGHDPLLLNNYTNRKLNKILHNSQIIPIIEWKHLDNMIPNSQKQLIVFGVSNISFATYMPDFSMEPLFPKSSILIFDPTIPAKDRDFVLVKLHLNNVFVFRQLLIDGEKSFIKSLNQDTNELSIRYLDNKSAIIAKLVETRVIL